MIPEIKVTHRVKFDYFAGKNNVSLYGLIFYAFWGSVKKKDPVFPMSCPVPGSGGAGAGGGHQTCLQSPLQQCAV